MKNKYNVVHDHHNEFIITFSLTHMQESFVMLVKAIRSLAGFYSMAGPSAPLPEDVKSDILNDLDKAEEFL